MENPNTHSEAEVKRLQSEISSLAKEIKGLRNQQIQLNSTISNMRHQTRDYQQAIDRIEAEHKTGLNDLQDRVQLLSQQENETILRLQTTILIAIVFAIAFILTLTLIGLTGLGIMQLETQTVSILAGATVVEAVGLIVMAIAYISRKPPTPTNQE